MTEAKVISDWIDLGSFYDVIKRSENLNIQGELCHKYLMAVLMHDDVMLLEKFADIGADIKKIKDVHEFAFENNLLNVLYWIIDNNLVSEDDEKPDLLFKLCEKTYSYQQESQVKKIIQKLIDQGVDLFQKNEKNQSYLEVARNSSNFYLLKDAMDKSKPNWSDELRNMIINNYHLYPTDIEKAYKLIQNGADPNTTYQNCGTILHLLAKIDNPDYLEKFVKLGCDIHFEISKGYKPIDISIAHNCVKNVAWFIGNGIDVNKGSRVISVFCGHLTCEDEIRMIKIFVDFGLDLLAKEIMENKIPLEWMKKYNYKNIKLIEYLTEETSKQYAKRIHSESTKLKDIKEKTEKSETKLNELKKLTSKILEELNKIN